MLMTLSIENIAIIERLELNIGEGFTVLTGETGAGKSILIDALNALLGGRVSRDLLRTGAERATVQGMFRMPPHLEDLLTEQGFPIESDGSLLLVRQFTDNGRNICRINGQITTVGILKTIGDKLVDIHGQHDSQSLLRPETHIDLLDLFAGADLQNKLTFYREELEKLHEMSAELRSLAGIGRERERNMDMLRFQIDELQKAHIRLGEDVELEQQSNILANSEDIVAAFSDAYNYLSGDDNERTGAVDALRAALVAVRKIAVLDNKFSTVADTLTELAERAGDVAFEVRDLRDGVEFDPKLQQKIEERLSLLQLLKRKYGDTLEACQTYLDESVKKLDMLENSEGRIAAIKAQMKQQEMVLQASCETLHQLREKAATILEQGIGKELSELDMPKCRFGVLVQSQSVHGFTPNGTDVVEFQISTNTGEPLKPLAKIASGGEMARVMLAIKSMLAGIDLTPTLIFDEIDAGVGGRAAQQVGEKLAALASGRQVLCVTHHAQIASLSDSHFFIRKDQVGERTNTSVQLLLSDEREHEITRLLSGEHRTETARSLARELLSAGAKTRKVGKP